MIGDSNDQSGMVGLLVGIIVLVFVGVGFSLMVDKRFKFSSGKASLEQAIADDKAELESLRRRVDVVRDDFKAKSQPVTSQPAELGRLKLEVSASTDRLRELREQRSVLKGELEDSVAVFAEYRANYRKRVRLAAAGEKLTEISAMGGKVYRDVTIRRVTSAGIEIIHAQGISRLSPDDLSDSWHERFQWDPEETAVVLKGEKAVAEQHDKVVEKQLQGEKEPVKPESALSPEKQAKQDADKKLVLLRREVTEAKRHLDRAEMEVARVRSDAGMSRGRSVPGSLETWNERISRLESAADKFRAQYVAARGRLATLAPNDTLLRTEEPSP